MVKDSINLVKKNDLNWQFSKLRKRHGSLFFKNIISYQQGSFIFEHADSTNYRLGGKVKASIKEFNVSQMKIHNFNLYGIFNDYKLVLGLYENPSNDYFNNEEKLLQVANDNISETELVSKTTFELDNRGLLFLKTEVNPKLSHLSHDYIGNTQVELLSKGELNLKELLWHNLP